MKQHLDKDQTIKLMELGFPMPKNVIGIRSILGFGGGVHQIGFENAYSIGELIEFLPKRIGDGLIDFHLGKGEWSVRYEYRRKIPTITLKKWHSKELIDALYDACTELKEQEFI